IFYGKPWQAFLEGVKRAENEMKVEVNCLATQELTEEIYHKVESLDIPQNLICVKGSRGMETEKVIKRLVKTFPSK
ncbi:MAG: hypothetical protein L6Q37_15220, partial [Bdellovibrionaceae bacterium]|nr:hypothetical protein [Pseudobdellovibrionaceae bacterium]